MAKPFEPDDEDGQGEDDKEIEELKSALPFGDILGDLFIEDAHLLGSETMTGI